MAYVITANRLSDGEVVYREPDGQWAERIGTAQVVDDKSAADELVALCEDDVKACRIVEPYWFEVQADNGVPKALSVREIIRTKGPTVRLDLGKQAGPGTAP